MAKILTIKQAKKWLAENHKNLNLENYCLVKDNDKIFIVSDYITQLPLDKYHIKRIGIPI